LPRTPRFRRIADDLRQAISRGRLPRGARLPSSRALARDLGVSRNTVLAAYETLAAEGWIAGRRGSGTRVAAAALPRPDPRRFLREAQFPVDPVGFRDADGNPIYLHR
jgi:GntR family transcriptional regulator/MocR family aminotransferase